ncbi:HlyD family efflux transporter periplasmic adaptor subunit, partial [candidate division GN15 bacterium]|nr:HlyD family efflux transporter periplasmic adaptor subunit [candidate division GN15 bacterium]
MADGPVTSNTQANPAESPPSPPGDNTSQQKESGMRKYLKFIVPAGILVLGFVVMNILLGMREDSPRRTPQQQPRIVATEVVQLTSVPAVVTAFGRVRSAEPVDLYSEVAGTLMPGDVAFKPAQTVSEGDLLLKIDDRQAELALNSSKSNLLTALAQVLPEIRVDFPQEYQVWQDYFDSISFDEPLAPLPQTDNQKIKLFLSRFNVYQLYFQIRDQEIRLEKHYFRAPFDGSIVSADLRVGSVTRNGTKLGQLISLEDLEVEVPVPARDIQWIDYTKPVRLISDELSGEWTGEIARIGSDIDTRTQAVSVFIQLDPEDQGALLNGVFMQARIPGKVIDSALSIPRRALYEQQYVYVIENG